MEAEALHPLDLGAQGARKVHRKLCPPPLWVGWVLSLADCGVDFDHYRCVGWADDAVALHLDRQHGRLRCADDAGPRTVGCHARGPMYRASVSYCGIAIGLCYPVIWVPRHQHP